jgi:membrane protein
MASTVTQPQERERIQDQIGAQGPDRPSELEGRRWWAILKRTVKEFRDDNLTDWAAALTYYAVLAIFPALIALISILGLVGESATDPLLDNIANLAPGPAGDILTGAIEEISSSPTAGIALLIGVVGALWSASGYVGAFSRASNSIYEVEEGRPFWKLRPLQIGLTTVMILLLALSALAVVLTGPLAEELGNVVGVGDTAVTVWDIAKWPVIAIAVTTMISVLYFATPNVKQPGFRWITPGGALALALWVLASAGFAFYIANFDS